MEITHSSTVELPNFQLMETVMNQPRMQHRYIVITESIYRTKPTFIKNMLSIIISIRDSNEINIITVGYNLFDVIHMSECIDKR